MRLRCESCEIYIVFEWGYVTYIGMTYHLMEGVQENIKWLGMQPKTMRDFR